jgi:kinetochore protein NDC80
MPPKARPPRARVSMIPRVGRENTVPPTPPPKVTNSGIGGGSAVKASAPGTGVKSSGRRRSSIGGPGLVGGSADRRQSVLQQQRTDPRPIGDKAFQQDCIKKLFAFLQTNGYDHPVSPKTLARPSGKDFTHIITFMLRLIDPAFQSGGMKLEDEVAMNFKALGYPLGVSKTALVAAGSPHTWPTLLAALAWLMTRIKTLQSLADDDELPLVGGVGGSTNAPVKFDSVEEMETKSDKFFFKYLSAAYEAFLKGDEKLQENLTYCLHDRLERDDKLLEMEIRQMEERNLAVTERINNLGRGEDE